MSLEALQMGDYGTYVWASFGVALLVYGWNLLAPRWRRREILEALSETTDE